MKRVVVIIGAVVILLCSTFGVLYLFGGDLNLPIFKGKTTTTKLVTNTENDDLEDDNNGDLGLPDDIGDSNSEIGENGDINNGEIGNGENENSGANGNNNSNTTNGTTNNNKTTTSKSASNSNKNTTTKKTTTTKKVDNSKKPKVSTDKFDSDINSVKLNPIKTRHPDIDKKVENIIKKVTDSSMTNNQKLYAIFRYVIDNAEYGNAVYSWEERQGIIDKYHYIYLDGKIVHGAKRLLDDKIGVCDDYASLLTVLARRIGFEAYFVGGQVKKAGGGTTGHAWVNIKANGNWYNLDAQIADKRPEQEKYYYGKTDKEVNLYTYDRNSYVNEFNKFKETTPIKLKVDLSGAVSNSKTITSYTSKLVDNVDFDAYVGSTLNISITGSGAKKYKYFVRYRTSDNYNYKTLYNSEETKTNIKLTQKFNDVNKNYHFIVSLTNVDTNVSAEYAFDIYVKEDDRIKDINVNYTKEVNGTKNYFLFDSTVTKKSSSSTCSPTFNYEFISTDDPIGKRGFYLVDGKYALDYVPGYTYKIKVTARCGLEKAEKTLDVS